MVNAAGEVDKRWRHEGTDSNSFGNLLRLVNGDQRHQLSAENHVGGCNDEGRCACLQLSVVQ